MLAGFETTCLLNVSAQLYVSPLRVPDVGDGITALHSPGLSWSRASTCAVWPTCSSWMGRETAARRGRGQDQAGSWRAVSFLDSMAPSLSWGTTQWLWVPPVRAGTLLSGGQLRSSTHPQESSPCPSNCGLGEAHASKRLSLFELSHPASGHAASLPQDWPDCGYQQRSTGCAVKARNCPLSSEIHQNTFFLPRQQKS